MTRVTYAMTTSPAIGPSDSFPEILSVVNRFHGDYWTLVRSIEQCINLQRFAQAELLLSTLGDVLMPAYHFIQQAARLHVAKGEWTEAVRACNKLLAQNAHDPTTLGLLITAWSELRDFQKALALVTETPPEHLSADWALERLFSTMRHQASEECDPEAAIWNAARVRPRDEIWVARMLRLAGRYERAEKLLRQLMKKKRNSREIQIELALTLLSTAGWHQHIESYKSLLSERDLSADVAQQLNRALNLYAIMKTAYSKGIGSVPDYHLPDSFLEVTFSATKNPLYSPVEGRVALVGATMAAGGAERVLGNAFVGLSNTSNFEPELWLYSRNPSLQHDFFIKELGIDKNYAQSCMDLHFVPPVEPFSFLPDGLSHNANAVYEKIRNRTPAVLHAWQDTTNLECAFAGILAGVPKIILHPHNMRPTLLHKAPIINSLRRSYKTLLSRPDVHAIFVSDASRRDYLDWLELPEGERCHVVYNGFDWQKELSPAAYRSRRLQIRQELRIPEQATVIGGVFRFHPVKRPKLWLEVARAFLRENPAAIFVIYGDGPDLADSKAYAQAIGIAKNVRFSGRVSGADEKIVAFDALLHTSETEGLPTVLIEAQVAGVPVVAYSTGGVPECVHPDISNICCNDGPADLAAGLTAMIDKLPSPAKVRAAARAVRTRFSRDTMIKHLESIYRM